MESFEDSQKKVLQLADDYKQLQKQKAAALIVLQKKKHDLSINKESQQKLYDDANKIQAKIASQEELLNSYVAKIKNQRKNYEKINSILTKSRKTRNENFMSWLMCQYPVFNTMTLNELKKWFLKALAHNAPDVSTHRQQLFQNGFMPFYVRDLLGQHKLDNHTLRYCVLHRNSVKRLRLLHNGLTIKHQDLVGNLTGQTLAEKQRIAINRQFNDPIDTPEEANNAEEISSSLGQQHAQADAKQYWADNPPKKESNSNDLKNQIHDITREL